MGTIEALSLAMGTAWTSGINLYATVGALGIAGQLKLIQLPQNLEVLTHPAVIAIACIMYLIEFFADKVPYVDSRFDELKIPFACVSTDIQTGERVVFREGSVALAAHGAKTTARLAINASPEPFSNWTASITEDIAVLGGIWLIFNHPIIMLILVLTFLALIIWLLPKIFRLAKRGFQTLRSKLSGVKPDQPASQDSSPQPT